MTKAEDRCAVCGNIYDGRCRHPMQDALSEHLRQPLPPLPDGCKWEHKTIYGGFVVGGLCDPEREVEHDLAEKPG